MSRMSISKEHYNVAVQVIESAKEAVKYGFITPTQAIESLEGMSRRSEELDSMLEEALEFFKDFPD